MLITKFGHSCFLVEEGSARLLVDPGNWSEDISGLKNIEALFISHEHKDHADIGKIKTVIQNNPNLIVYTNPGVGKILTENKITWTEFTRGQTVMVKGMSVEAIGETHASIYVGLVAGEIPNTGLFIAGRLYYPGDSFALPNKPVEILALPVCAPWLKMAEAIDFAKAVKPQVCFPVHDGMLKHLGPFHNLPKLLLEPEGIKVIIPEIGQTFEV